MFFLKLFAKKLFKCIPVNIVERLLSHSIRHYIFPELKNLKTFNKREEVWADLLKNFNLKRDNITYIEYGVYTGCSMKYFSAKINDCDSLFFGLDTFRGLPEDWNKNFKKGDFGVDGETPDIMDDRVFFIKGLFQDTNQDLLNKIKKIKIGHLIVHYDADLYSSTLFALVQIDSLKKPYFAIFDEFSGDETRALYDYVKSHLAIVKFISCSRYADNAESQLLCYIEPYGSSIALANS
jgi:hypothetical protein